MDIKPWEYADFPAFNEPVPGATRVPTTGDEIGVTYHPDVPYATAGTTTLHLQILVPQTRNQTDATTYPCMVHVQGSAWMKQDRTALVPTLSRIAERGFVVAIVEYRHSGIASFPAQIQDARNAVRFMRANAAQYHADADNLFLSGCSSGGQVALLAAALRRLCTGQRLKRRIEVQIRRVQDAHAHLRRTSCTSRQRPVSLSTSKIAPSSLAAPMAAS